MSSTKTSSVKYSVRPFFGFVLRQNWQHLALYTILALLVMFIPCLLSFADGIPDFHSYNSSAEYVLGMMDSLNKIAVCLSGVIGIFAGMSAVGYINSKAHVGCWHSFPISRTKLYLIETGVRAIYYGIAILTGFVSAHILAAVFFGVGIAGMSMVFLTGLLQAVSCFMLVYSVTLFAGGLCGTAPMRFIMLCIISFLPVALYALGVYLVSDGMMGQGVNLYESFYTSDEYLQVICLPYRAILFTGLEDNRPALMCLLLIPEAALYYVGGLLLHKYRKSEMSGTTIVWKPVFAVVKYAILFTCGLFGMFAIGSEYVTGNGGVLRAVLGTFIGLIVAFMLMNAILYKSSRAMFRGIKPFLVCAAVTLAVVFLVPLNVTGLIGRDYSASAVKRLEIDSYDLAFTDREKIENLMTLMLEKERVDLPAQNRAITMDGNEEYLKKWFGSASNPENWDEVYYKEMGIEPAPGRARWTTSIRVTEYPVFGFPFAKYIEIDTNSEFWKTIRISEEYREANDITSLSAEDVQEITVTLGEKNLHLYHNESRNTSGGAVYEVDIVAVEEYVKPTISDDGIILDYTGEAWNAPAQAILDQCVVPEGYPDQPVVGQVWVRYTTEDGCCRSRYCPIYADNFGLIGEYGKLKAQAEERYNVEAQKAVTANTPEEVIAMLVPDDTQAILVNYETAQAKKLDVSELRELLSDAVCVSRDRSFDTRTNSNASDVPYGIYISRGIDSSHNEIRFRGGAVTEEELAAYFAALD